MSERPRYLTDEEMYADSTGEGFGILCEVTPRKTHPAVKATDEALAENKKIFRPIIEQAMQDLYADHHDIMRMETEGIMIFQASNISPEESPK